MDEHAPTGPPAPPGQRAHLDGLVPVVYEELKQMCVSGQCCCPVVQAKPCTNPNPVRRCGDAIGQSCCTFPNECSAPGPAEGWFPG